MAASALPETLKSITATKFQELTNQRDTFERAKSDIQTKTSTDESVLEYTQTLLKGVSRLHNVRLRDEDTSDEETYQSSGPTAYCLRNSNLLLLQAKLDPSLSSSIVTNIRNSLEHSLELESVRHQHAKFFSELVTEWLSNPDDKDAKSPDALTFENVGRKEMHEQRTIWESLVFHRADVDPLRIDAYLKKLFTGSKAARLAYNEVVKSNKIFSSELRENPSLFDPEILRSTMNGVISTDLLSEEKNSTLRTFMSNKEVLKEVSDVLNMRFATLETWKWETTGTGIPVEMRRQLNGKYRVFMDEDILDALFTYRIGLKWAIQLKCAFKLLLKSSAWKKDEHAIPRVDRQRREYYLSDDDPTSTVPSMRSSTYENDYFLTQLPVNEILGKRDYDDDNSAEYEEMPSQAQKGPLELKHSLLHMLVTEATIARNLRPDDPFTIIRSDFKWFGPSLPHDTVYTVLRFFGVNETWLKFFRTFLEVPTYFKQDGPNAETQIRKRGLPMSHMCSDVFGEAVLFVMDFAVNQATSSFLYRLHDDFWLWGSDEACLKGWQAMILFAEVMGIEFNTEKTGTVRLGVAETGESSDADSSDTEATAFRPDTTTLPKGEVRWGFLRLDGESGKFIVDQYQVDEHIEELKIQLSRCCSIFSYIQSYNAYVGRFFTNNFGKPSFAFGREHVDMMVSAFARIQQSLFPSGNVTEYLSGLAKQRFGITDLPQGFWYFPVAQGGLELRNPLIPLLGMRESLRLSPERLLEKAFDKDEADYIRNKQMFKDKKTGGGFGRYNAEIDRQVIDSGESFLPKEEFLRYREQKSRNMAELYVKFMSVPPEECIKETAELSSLLTQGSPDLPIQAGRNTILRNFDSMQPYWKWMVALYGKEIVQRYGSVRMVDGGQVPLGVVSLMKKGRVRWAG